MPGLNPSIILTLLLILAANVCHGDQDQDMEYLYSLSLLELSMLEVNVTIATGSTQKVTDAPAIVSIISAQDIHYWGFQSVAEAINHQPGIYCIDDGLSFNCGLRGVSGGFRGYSKVLKIMINGQPISFRSDSNNFLGQELIPVTAIKRIEIVRGPSSALYGANAFLGVINIITGVSDRHSNQISLTMGSDGHGFSGYYQHQQQDMGWLFSLAASRLDYSGRKVPDTLPRRSLFSSGEQTRDDTSKPMSSFVQGHLLMGHHTLTLNAHYSRLDNKANFVDLGRFIETGELGTDARYSIYNGFLQAKDSWQFNQDTTIEFSVAYAKGGPTHLENLDVGLSNSIAQRDLGYEALDVTAKVLWQISQSHHFSAGLDHTLDNEKLFESYKVDKITGEKTQQGINQGHRNFINSGIYLQHSATLSEQLATTLNVRADEHNIYGQNENMRAALVYQIHDTLSSKFLYSTSYKAPAALQLFGQPLFDGEISDNALLSPETANTAEAQLNWSILKNLTLSVNSYQMKVEDKVEIISQVTNSSPQNQGTQRSAGVEAVIAWYNHKHQISINTALQKSESEGFDILAREVVTPSDLYPEKMLNIFWQHRYNQSLSTGLHGRFISARRASDSNIALNGGQAYDLGYYWLLNAVFHYGFRQGNIRVKVNNMLDKIYSEPGFSSIDIPGIRRNIQLKLDYQF